MIGDWRTHIFGERLLVLGERCRSSKSSSIDSVYRGHPTHCGRGTSLGFACAVPSRSTCCCRCATPNCHLFTRMATTALILATALLMSPLRVTLEPDVAIDNCLMVFGFAALIAQNRCHGIGSDRQHHHYCVLLRQSPSTPCAPACPFVVVVASDALHSFCL